MKIKCKCGSMGISNTKCRKCSVTIPAPKKEVVEKKVVEKKVVEKKVVEKKVVEKDFNVTKSEEE